MELLRILVKTLESMLVVNVNEDLAPFLALDEVSDILDAPFVFLFRDSLYIPILVADPGGGELLGHLRDHRHPARPTGLRQDPGEPGS